jgi:hypothetical protein
MNARQFGVYGEQPRMPLNNYRQPIMNYGELSPHIANIQQQNPQIQSSYNPKPYFAGRPGVSNYNFYSGPLSLNGMAPDANSGMRNLNSGQNDNFYSQYQQMHNPPLRPSGGSMEQLNSLPGMNLMNPITSINCNPQINAVHSAEGGLFNERNENVGMDIMHSNSGNGNTGTNLLLNQVPLQEQILMHGQEPDQRSKDAPMEPNQNTDIHTNPQSNKPMLSENEFPPLSSNN